MLLFLKMITKIKVLYLQQSDFIIYDQNISLASFQHVYKFYKYLTTDLHIQSSLKL